MSSPVRPGSFTLAQPIPVPTLTVLPPSSDTESWSRSPSPRPSRSGRLNRSHCSRTRTKRRKGDRGYVSDPQGRRTPQIVVEESAEGGLVPRCNSSPSGASHTEGGQGEDSPSHDLLLPPVRSWSRSPSPSRRSRWSLKSLLNKDSDGDSCRLVSWIQPKRPACRVHRTEGHRNSAQMFRNVRSGFQRLKLLVANS